MREKGRGHMPTIGSFSPVSAKRAKKIEWCSFEIIEAIFECVVRLSKSTVQWKYIQILSGVDAPLKTNLEMVRIFKALNGSFNTEVLPFERYRLHGKRVGLISIQGSRISRIRGYQNLGQKLATSTGEKLTSCSVFTRSS
ncbi:hypothetical protein Y032_0048g1604 [Ancylostoma ceylanicum]|uniref:Uncharacterized protein n=1 Tax=Ancylostoma ceylanicum TaxID=53326 RepID=A0A016UBX7_9BILA|nr:hypothetical protein Y032_0048g1604 [Ancylostoma ceylanicum]